MENKVCVYAICKNESDFVEKWYNTMKEADLIVVLDTGSTDDTVDKFNKLIEDGANILLAKTEVKPWRFDVARNAALDLVPEEYNILVSTDLDEILSPGWSNYLRDRWTDRHTRAEYFYAWSHDNDGNSQRVFRYNKVHSRKWRWRYPVHELLYNIDTNSESYSDANTLKLSQSEMFLEHFPDLRKSRSNYLPLLELRAKEDENDYYGLIYLAHEYYYKGYYQKSIDTLTKCTQLSTYDSLTLASCYLFLGDNYVKLNRTLDAIQSYKWAIEVDYTYREPYLNLAQCYLDIKEYEKAILAVNTGLAKSYRHYTWLERDTSWTSQPHDILSVSYFYTGDKYKSYYHAVRAKELSPAICRLSDNLKRIYNDMVNNIG